MTPRKKKTAPAPPPLTGWQCDYKLAVLTYFYEQGDLLPAPDEKLDPWNDGKSRQTMAMHEHFKTCGFDVDKSTMVEDTDWSTWGGTFGDDQFHVGGKVGIFCQCGEIAPRYWRLGTGELGELINGLLKVSEKIDRECPNCGGEVMGDFCQGKDPRWKSCGWFKGIEL
jgi:hypothetical protein